MTEDLQQPERLDIEQATSYRNRKNAIIGGSVLFVGIAIFIALAFLVPNNDPITNPVSDTNDDGGYFSKDKSEPTIFKANKSDDEYLDPPIVAEAPSALEIVQKRTQLTFDEGVSPTQAPSNDNSTETSNQDTLAIAASRVRAAVGDTAQIIDESIGRNLVAAVSGDIDETMMYRRANNGDIINAGAFIPACMVNAIDSSLPGDLISHVTDNIYSSDGKTLLIPKYSQLYGEYRAARLQGEVRIFAIWNRLRVGHDKFIDLKSPSTDNLGRSGLEADINTRFAQRFGASLLLSVMPVALNSGSENENNNRLVEAAGNELRSASAIALRNSINLPPILTRGQAKCFNVMVNKDLRFTGV